MASPLAVARLARWLSAAAFVAAALPFARTAHAQSGHALSFHPFQADEVSVPLATPEGAFTLEAWVRSYADPEAYGYFTILEFGDDRPFFGVIGNALAVDGVVRAGTPLPTGTWQHVAYTFDGTTSRLYLNAVEVASSGVAPGRGGVLGIGHGIGDTGWTGTLDEVIVWSAARTAVEIAADMHGLTAVETTDSRLVAYFKFDEGAGQVTRNARAGGPDGVLGATLDVEINDPAWTVLVPTSADDAPRAGVGLRLTNVGARPARMNASVEVEASLATPIAVAVYDALGRRVVSLHDGRLAPGVPLRLDIPVADLAPGVYAVRASGGGTVASRPLVVTR